MLRRRMIGIINMSTDVNKIIENAVVQVRSILTQAVEQVDESARADLIERFNESVGGKRITTVKAPRPRYVAKAETKVAVKPKAKKASVKAKTKKVAAKTKVKAKRVVSEATRKKLAANLKKARDAKAAKASAPAKNTKTKAKKK